MIDSRTGDEDMQYLLLQVLGAFTHVQGWIDNAAHMLFLKRMPKAAEVVGKLAVSRIRDDERLKLFAAVATELGSDAELKNFASVYLRVKRLRDFIGHSANIEEADDSGRVVLQKPHLLDGRRTTTSYTAERSELVTALRDCQWLEAQIRYALSSSEVILEVIHGSLRAEIVKPTANPDDWDGVSMRIGMHRA